MDLDPTRRAAVDRRRVRRSRRTHRSARSRRVITSRWASRPSSGSSSSPWARRAWPCPRPPAGPAPTLLDLALAVEALGRRLAPAPLIEHAVAARLLAARRRAARRGGRRRRASPPSRSGPSRDRVARLVPAGAVATTSSRSTATTSWRSTASPARTCPTSRPRPSPTARSTARPACSRPARSPSSSTVRRSTSGACSPPPRSSGLGLGALEIGVALRDRARAVRRARSARSRRCSTRSPTSRVALDGAQLLARKAAWASRLPAATTPRELGAMAFLFAAEQAQRASDRALHFHGGYGFMEEYDIQLFYRRAKGWANVLDEPGPRVRARLADLRYGAGRGRRELTWTSPRRPRPSSSATRCARSSRRVYTDERRQHAHDTGTMHDWELHRAMADQGWIAPGAARGARRRRPRPRGAGGAVPRARARGRAVRRPEHLHDGGVGARARGQRDAAAGDPAQAAERRVADRARLLGARLRLRRRRGADPRRARRRRLAHRRPEDVHQRGRGVGVGVPPHPHQPRRAQAPRPHVLPRAHARRPGSSCSRSARCRASAPTSRSTTACASATSGASARSTAAGR